MVLGLAVDLPVRNPSTRATWRGDPVSGSIDTRPWTPSERLRLTTALGGFATVLSARRCRTAPARPSRRESKVCRAFCWLAEVAARSLRAGGLRRLGGV